MKEGKWATEQIQDFDKRIRFMEKMNKIWAWESCSQILVYLELFGKKTATELRRLIGLKGEKSIYKSLKILVEAGSILKEEDDHDARISYYYRNPDSKVIDPDFDELFLQYLTEINNFGIIAEYLSNANKSSIAFIQVVTDIMKNQMTQYGEDGNRRARKILDGSTFHELVVPLPDPDLFRKELVSFIQKQFHKHIEPRGDTREPMKTPAAFYLAFMPIDEMHSE